MMQTVNAAYEQSYLDNRYTFGSIFGLVDKVPPSVYGLPSPAVNLRPLDIEFTEDLECEFPYSFTVYLRVSEYDAHAVLKPPTDF